MRAAYCHRSPRTGAGSRGLSRGFKPAVPAGGCCGFKPPSRQVVVAETVLAARSSVTVVPVVGPGHGQPTEGGGEQQRPAQHVHGPDPGDVEQYAARQEADEPAGLPDHVEAGEGPTAQPSGTRDWISELKVTLPVEVDTP